MAIPARINLVTLGVADVARATRFYEDIGWHRSSASQASISFFKLGGTVLALYGADALAEDAALPLAAGDGFRGVALAINVDDEAEADRVLAEAASAGASILKPAAKQFWGGYSGYFADPDGHAWEVAHNPHFVLRADGTVDLPD